MKNGFTLVELLAVIVILAVLALIATPVVLSIIDDAKESAMLRSAEMYLSGVENAVMRENMNSGGNFRPNNCTISSEGNLDCEGKDGIIEVEVNGEKPNNGSIVFENGKIKEVELTYQSGTIIKDENGNLVYEGSNSNITYESLGNWEHKLSDGTVEAHDTNSGNCSKCNQKVLAPGVHKPDGSFISWEQLISKDYQSIEYYINAGASKVTGSIINIDENGALKTCFDDDMLKNDSSNYLIGTLVIDKSVKKISHYAFKMCSNITNIILSNSVTLIESYAFADCSVENIEIPNSVIEIEGLAFGDCQNLKSITIPDSITKINAATFLNCSSLQEIVIPSSVIAIEIEAFLSCENLKKIVFIGTQEQWNCIELKKNWNWFCKKITVHCTDGDIEIPEWTDV